MTRKTALTALAALYFTLSLAALPAMPIDNNSTPTPPILTNPTSLKVSTTTTAPGVATVPKFRLTCKYVAGGVFDPIVYPGQTGLGHHHTFFGNTTVNPNSTSADLNANESSGCMGGIMNKSAYWIPSMYDTATGIIKKPKDAIVYYSTPKAIRLLIQPIPDGLSMIAPVGHSSWNCQAWPSPAYGSGLSIPVCTKAGQRIRGQLSFPNCWDGVNLDSADHHSHMAYSATPNPALNDCPASHPVRIASFTMIVDWSTTVDNESAHWRLSSDGEGGLPGWSFHGDYMEGWTQKWMNVIVNNCLRADKDCDVGLLGIDPDDGLLKRAN